MAITSTGLNAATNADYTATKTVKDKSTLGKDDFMKLLLAQLQHQDPTAPMDSEKILAQTSQLASLESSDNTNKALEKLSASLSNTQQFSTIAAIGKTANLGNNNISYDGSAASSFELYFPSDVKQGKVKITDTDDNLVATLDVGANKSGVYKFDWDGTDVSGNPAKEGIYKVSADYTDTSGESMSTKLGTYPIESVKFEEGKTLLKLGSSYVPLEKVVEVY